MSPTSDERWLKEQEKIFNGALNVGDRLASQAALVGIGCINERQPMFILDRRILSLTEAVEEIRSLRQVEFVFLESGLDSGRFEWQVPDSLQVIVGQKVVAYRLHPLVKLDQEIKAEDDLSSIPSAGGATSFQKIMRTVLTAIGEGVFLERRLDYVSDYDRRRRLFIFIERR